jgi:heme A synthase
MASRVVIGALGVLLSLTVLAASALIRLATTLNDGVASTSLPQAIEDPVRLVHRIAAMGISGLAVWAFVLAWRARKAAQPSDRSLHIATIILLLTVFLSALGPFTPGYHFDAVTVGNVAGGVALILAFQAWWWATMKAPQDDATNLRAGRWALIAFTAQVMLGALVSAQAMTQRFDALLPHIVSAIMVVAFTVVWWMRDANARRALSVALALVALQCADGAALALMAERPLLLAVGHAMLSPLTGMALIAAWYAKMGRRDDA